MYRKKSPEKKIKIVVKPSLCSESKIIKVSVCSRRNTGNTFRTYVSRLKTQVFHVVHVIPTKACSPKSVTSRCRRDVIFLPRSRVPGICFLRFNATVIFNYGRSEKGLNFIFPSVRFFILIFNICTAVWTRAVTVWPETTGSSWRARRSLIGRISFQCVFVSFHNQLIIVKTHERLIRFRNVTFLKTEIKKIPEPRPMLGATMRDTVVRCVYCTPTYMACS